jgi:hypothetical protein
MTEVIIIISVFAAIIIFFMFASKSGAKLIKEREEKLSRAGKGKAKILGSIPMGLRGTGSGGQYQAYKFTLEAGNGFQIPYKTEVVWEVYPMGAPKVQDGMEVDVKIDADDPNIVYPVISNIEYSWTGAMMGKNRS